VSETADIVVAGGGHNSLITAAYLAKAGYSVVVLDARAEAGGGAASEELLDPGYWFDTCSTGHTLIQANPLMRNDELGLVSEYGLEYIEPDPVAHVVFPDGEAFTMWHDLDRTCDEIARFSPKDADAYRRMLDEYDAIKDVQGRYRFNPIGFAPTPDEMLMERPGGSKWLRRNAISAWDVIGREFESRHVQSFMLWMAYQTLQPADSLGSGGLAYSLIYGRQQRSWSIPKGGSGELSKAIVRAFEDLGGRIECNKRVSGLVVENGRCTGVETDDGERYMGTKAVVSTIHVKDLVDMAPADEWGDDFLYGIDTYDEGTSVFAVYLQTTEAPQYPAAGGGGTISAVSAGPIGWPEDVLRLGREVRQGKLQTDGTWLLIATPSLADPSRVPEGGGQTVKLLGPQPYEPEGDDPARWAELKYDVAAKWREQLVRCAPNMTDDKIAGMYVKSPVDVWESNPHMWHGAMHGGDRGLAHSGKMRPAPGWAQHRMPIDGLYQTGATTHPGGSITGGPGRNAAIVMLTDFGHDPAAVMSAHKEVVG
jgi:phytoene dehydrogenase-like protein